MTRFLFLVLFLIPLRVGCNPFPISIVNGLLISKATIDGKEVLVIFDTGAPGLVLNNRFFSPDNKTKIECVGINGSFECRLHQVKNWSWMGISHKKTKALLSDLTFLEDELHQDVYALIGLSAVEDYFVYIDFDQRSISLSDKMNVDKQSVIRFQYAGHLPVISCTVNGKEKNLGLDTGSEINYLFSPDAPGSDNFYKNASPVSIIGTDNHKVMKFALNMDLSVNHAEIYPSPFIVDTEQRNTADEETSFDGLLGQPFLSQFNITIHPTKQIIILSPRQQGENLPSTLTAQL